MTLSIWHLLVLAPILLLIEGFYSGSEIALLAADKVSLKAKAQKGSKGAALALELAQHPEQILSTTLFITNLCIIALSVLIALYTLARTEFHAELIAVAITSPLVVILGEIVPKTLYQRHANAIAPYVAHTIRWAYWAFYPFTKLLGIYTHRLARAVGPIEELLTGKRKTTREELRALISYGKGESEIKTSEKRMIRKIFDFRDTEAKHALIPLVKVDAIDKDSKLRDAIESFKQHRHSRMPVYSERIDNIVGIIEVSDLLAIHELDQLVEKFMKPAHYAPEAQALEDLLRDLRESGAEMCVVVDEYGGAVGVLTIEDIVEEVVGEISDEFDAESTAFKEISPTSWLVQARVEIPSLNEQLGLELPEGDYETLGGFLLQQFGRIPEVGDELYFDTPKGTLRITVKKSSQRSIQSVTVEQIIER